MNTRTAVKYLSLLTLEEGDFWNITSSLRDDQLPGLFGMLQKHKTLYQYVYRSARCGNDRYLDMITPYFVRSGDWKPNSYSSLLSFVDNSIELSLSLALPIASQYDDVLLLKGSAIRQYLPAYRRYQQDVDLYVGSDKTARSLIQDLASRGFQLVGNIMEGHEKNCRTLFAEMSRPGCLVGFHSCFYPMGSSRYPVFLISDFLSRSQRVETQYGNVRIPAIEDTILILVAHIMRHGYRTYRDLNDLYLLLRKCCPNLEELTANLSTEGLELVFEALLYEMADLYGIQSTGRRRVAHGIVGRLLDRGNTKSLTGSFVVQAYVLLWMRQGVLGKPCALMEMARMLFDLGICRLFSPKSALRRFNQRCWRALLPEERRFVHHASMDGFWETEAHTRPE